MPIAQFNYWIETLGNGNLKYHIAVKPQREVVGCEFIFQQLECQNLIVDGRPVSDSLTGFKKQHLLLHAIKKEGVKLSFEIAEKQDFKITIVERSLGIPDSWLKIPRPDFQIVGPNIYSNACFTRKTFELK